MVASYTVANYLNVLIASNEEWVIPAGKNSRRYFVLKCNDSLSELKGADKTNMCKEIANVPFENLAHYLYTRDITDFDPTIFPITEGLKEQQSFSDGPVLTWWKDNISNEHINNRPIFCDKGFMKEFIYNQFCDSRFATKYINSVLFWKQMKDVVNYNEIKKQLSGVRKRYVIFEKK